MAYVKDHLYLTGGNDRSDGQDKRTCKKLNLLTKQWESMASLNYGRRHHTTTYVEDRLYVIGGYGGTLGSPAETTTLCYRRTEEYDLDRNTWTALGTDSYFPNTNGIHRHCTVAVDTRLWVMGGTDCTRARYEVFIFDTRTKRWSSAAKNLLHGGVYDQACEVVYLQDGRKVIMQAGGTIHNVGRRNYVQMLDLANEANDWVSLNGLPQHWAEQPHMAYFGK